MGFPQELRQDLQVFISATHNICRIGYVNILDNVYIDECRLKGSN